MREEARAWVERRGGRWDEVRYAEALARAMTAEIALQGRTVAEWLGQAGVSIVDSDAPARFGTAIVRATVDLDSRRVTVYRETVEPDLREVVIAHEAFHLLDPDCPDPIAEMAAHLFAARTSSIGVFPGVLDLKA